MLLDLPTGLLGAVVKRMDWNTLCAASATCAEMRAVCDPAREEHKRAWLSDPANPLGEYLKTACARGEAAHAKLILKTLRSQLSKEEEAIFSDPTFKPHTRWNGADSLRRIVNGLLADTIDRRGHSSIVQVLLDAGANPSWGHGTTPLHMAFARGLDYVAALLVAAGADREAKDCHGMTPADLVAEMRRRHFVKYSVNTRR